MLKNKFKLIAMLLITILLFFVPMSLADEGTEIAPISEESGDTAVQESEEEQLSEDSITKSDVYLIGDDITIDYLVDGNAFIIGKNVTINSQIGGDVFVIANNLTIGQQGAIYSNLFALSNSIDIQGIAYDIYTFSQDITISGAIYRDFRIACSNLNLFGRIARNGYLICDTMNFASENTDENQDESSFVPAYGVINGNLEYSAINEISIPENSVLGEIKYTNIKVENDNTIQQYIISLGTFLITTIVIWLLCLWLTPKFLERTSVLASKKILPIIGFGILGFIAIPFVSILLLTVELTTTISLLLLTMYFVLIAISSSILSISIANCIAKKFNVDKVIGILGILILTSIVLWALKLIPTIGGIIGLAYIVLGMGIILYSLISKNSKNSKNSKETKEEQKA